MNNLRFTPTQEKLLAILADGAPHLRQELLDVFDDPMPTRKKLTNHLMAIRKVLRPIGHDIVCQLLYQKCYYRHVRILAPLDRE